MSDLDKGYTPHKMRRKIPKVGRSYSRHLEEKKTFDKSKQDINDLVEELYIEKADKIPGGLADKKSPKDFDQDALKEGVKVELEHTSDKKIATEIAMDHLTEDPMYYKKLKTIEKSMCKACMGLQKGEMCKACFAKKQGVPEGVDPAKHERCVQDVKAQGKDKSSAYAICNASMKKSIEEEILEEFLEKGGPGSGRRKGPSMTRTKEQRAQAADKRKEEMKDTRDARAIIAKYNLSKEELSEIKDLAAGAGMSTSSFIARNEQHIVDNFKKSEELEKAKYTRRTGSPGNYKYEYAKPGSQSKKTSNDDLSDMQNWSAKEFDTHFKQTQEIAEQFPDNKNIQEGWARTKDEFKRRTAKMRDLKALRSRIETSTTYPDSKSKFSDLKQVEEEIKKLQLSKGGPGSGRRGHSSPNKNKYDHNEVHYYIDKYKRKFGKDGMQPQEAREWFEGAGLSERETKMAMDTLGMKIKKSEEFEKGGPGSGRKKGTIKLVPHPGEVEADPEKIKQMKERLKDGKKDQNKEREKVRDIMDDSVQYKMKKSNIEENNMSDIEKEMEEMAGKMEVISKGGPGSGRRGNKTVTKPKDELIKLAFGDKATDEQKMLSREHLEEIIAAKNKKEIKKSTIDPKEEFKQIILNMGSEGLKKAMPTLKEEEQELVKSTLEEILKAKKVEMDDKYDGDKKFATLKNMGTEVEDGSDDEDEKLVKPAAAEMRQQGGSDAEGEKPWEGQVIKAKEMEDKKEDKAKEKVVEAMDEIAEGEAEEAKEEHEKEMHSKKESKKMKKSLEELQALKEQVVKSYEDADLSYTDELVKAEMKKRLLKEEDQVEMGGQDKGGKKNRADKKSVPEIEVGKDADETADEATAKIGKMKKSISWGDPQASLRANTLGRNFHYNVNGYYDECLEKAKSKSSEGEKLSKSEKEELDLNDYIEKGFDKSHCDANSEEIQKSQQIGEFTKNSYSDLELADAMNISVEELKEILGE